jgi:hypothetical protein
MAKLSGTLTETDNLTKKANDFLSGIVNDNLARQNKIEGRIMTLENRCLRADINPPLGAVNLGNDLYGSDEEFDRKVDQLIASETERKAEMEERIKKQLEADNQKKLDDALDGQQQAAVEAVRQEQPKPEQQQGTVKPEDDAEIMKDIGNAPAWKSEYAPTSNTSIADDKKIVTVSAQFKIKVRSHITPQAVADHLKTKLPADLLEALTVCEGQ